MTTPPEADLEAHLSAQLPKIFPHIPPGDIDHQTHLALRFGRNEITVNGETKWKKEGRADIVLNHKGKPIAVIEQRFSNGVLQEILLENPTSSAGQNVLVARAFGPMGHDRGMERMSLDEPTTADIRREMRERFPGVNMTISETFVQNRYGPFGFATGRLRGGVSCIYAWQEIRAKKSVLFPGYRGAVTWRLRFCDANASPRELLYLPYGLNVNVYFLQDNWNIYGKPPEPNPDIGKLGRPLGPDKVVEDLSMAPPSGYGNYRRNQTTTRRPRSRRPRRRADWRTSPPPAPPWCRRRPRPRPSARRRRAAVRR